MSCSEERRSIARLDGETAVGLGIQKQSGTNTVEVIDLVKKELKKVEPTLPPGMKLSISFDQSRFIKTSISEVQHHLIIGGFLGVTMKTGAITAAQHEQALAEKLTLRSPRWGLVFVILVATLLPFAAFPFRLGFKPTFLDAALAAFVLVHLLMVALVPRTLRTMVRGH